VTGVGIRTRAGYASGRRDRGRLEEAALIVRVLDPPFQHAAQLPQFGLVLAIAVCRQIVNLMRVRFQIVELLRWHRRCSECSLGGCQLALGIELLEQVPYRIAALLVFIVLKEWTLRREIADVAITAVAHRAETEDRLVASVAGTEGVEPRWFG